ncbi:hypothetical protein GUITHDRAFT_142777 [Guillardia theta CCMP2712]|uniref:Uncharacterized protein n=1 Tax=Guillardia theta (strain CCMP2712) TaxID=905079 RepID=L1IW56_GUITC|nr:hypothetical protein GUITHDRAFT_142777 [Guillardia theta CCMP2712]EKX40471.1 hypothetical protein GUITHDRAFT_142777 [Guillardia theta CCMP2712]|eukprot:XP_005827451.1 hypothetical protein GUITHDRAFT_142777 [Guillardia theta CCMP2712]
MPSEPFALKTPPERAEEDPVLEGEAVPADNELEGVGLDGNVHSSGEDQSNCAPTEEKKESGGQMSFLTPVEPTTRARRVPKRIELDQDSSLSEGESQSSSLVLDCEGSDDRPRGSSTLFVEVKCWGLPAGWSCTAKVSLKSEGQDPSDSVQPDLNNQGKKDEDAKVEGSEEDANRQGSMAGARSGLHDDDQSSLPGEGKMKSEEDVSVHGDVEDEQGKGDEVGVESGKPSNSSEIIPEVSQKTLKVKGKKTLLNLVDSHFEFVAPDGTRMGSLEEANTTVSQWFSSRQDLEYDEVCNLPADALTAA